MVGVRKSFRSITPAVWLSLLLLTCHCQFDPVAQVGSQDGSVLDGGGVCGNGVVNQGEECDDSDVQDGDGCSSDCRVEDGWVCHGEPSVCSDQCGNGVIDRGEDCDGTDLGGASCQLLGCDGGTLVCSAQCTYDVSSCGDKLCGNGHVDEGEACDSGGQDSATCDFDCTLPECGDGHVNRRAGEDCDDANGVSNDGCSTSCRVEPYFVCDDSDPTRCSCRVYVDRYAPGNADGTTWDDAYLSVGQGVAKASALVGDGADRCDVWVVEGDYPVFETTAEDTVLLGSHVAVLGGFARGDTQESDRNPTQNVTRISGCSAPLSGCDGRVMHVFTAHDAVDATLDGLVVSDARSPQEPGGGLRVSGGRLFLSNCVFQDNLARHGGGVAVFDGGGVLVRDTNFFRNETPSDSEAGFGGAIWAEAATVSVTGGSFEHNFAKSYGGAVQGSDGATVSLYGVTFSTNTAHYMYGGAVDCRGCSILVTQCTFRENLSGDDGGAVGLHGDAQGVFSGCVFERNATEDENQYRGGAVSVSQSVARFEGCRFVGNHSHYHGGALYGGEQGQLTVERCWFQDNQAGRSGDGGGGGMSVYGDGTHAEVFDSVFWRNESVGFGAGAALIFEGATAQFVNCTVYDNSATGSHNHTGGIRSYHEDSFVEVINSILWGNPGGQLTSGDNATHRASWSDIQDRTDPSAHVFSADPRFFDGGQGNFALQPNSPCIDAADGSVASDQDFEATPRWDDPAVDDTGGGSPAYVDMGALERHP